MTSGYIRLWRKSLDSPVWDESASVWKVFSYCLLRATHEPHDFKRVHLKKGAFIFGDQDAAEDCRMSRITFRQSMDRLVSLGMITIERTMHGSTCNVLGFEQHQQDMHGCIKSIQPTIQPTIHIQEGKECKESNTIVLEADKQKRRTFIPPTLGEAKAYATGASMTVTVEAWFDHFSASGWKMKGGQTIKDWHASLRTWARNEPKFAAMNASRKRADNYLPDATGHYDF